jgi:beta-glucosidase/6-phospho-beta-glucosidase/beta-galactosidase
VGIYPESYAHGGRFPLGFEWALGSAAYQIEGGWKEGGRGLSIWDVFTGADGSAINPGMRAKGQTASVGCDGMRKYREDIQVMKSLGVGAYRFSISWPRLLPNGTHGGAAEHGSTPQRGVPNAVGLAFYNALIDELLAAGIAPHVTIYHWDLPQALLDDPHSGHRSQFNGWLDPRLPALFADYAELCFAHFGDRVGTWYTFNEPRSFAVLGHVGTHAPSLCNHEQAGCRPHAGTHPYIAGHHVLLAHGLAVRRYREGPSVKLAGARVGICLSFDWSEPASTSELDIAAAERAHDWWLGWFADPIWLGDYPQSMRRALGSRLPRFSEAEKGMLKGSADLLGINHYSTSIVSHQPNQPQYGADSEHPPSYWMDGEYKVRVLDEWPSSNSSWLKSVPWGLRKAVVHVHRKYPAAAIMITELGWSTTDELPTGSALCDAGRIDYLANYASELLKAIQEDEVPVLGLTAWSVMDNFEWAEGFAPRFGVVYVDYTRPTRDRYLKASACWLASVIANNALVDTHPFSERCTDRPIRRAISFGDAARLASEAARDAPGAWTLAGTVRGTLGSFHQICDISLARQQGKAPKHPRRGAAGAVHDAWGHLWHPGNKPPTPIHR